MIRYPLTIFLSAFLLFQVQPLIGKVILPWFGGSPAVWTACMLFFQILLLGGYSYAHFVSGKLSPKALAIVHGGLLLLSLAYLPVTPAIAWKPTGSEMPLLRILGLLVFTIGLPYFLLSSTGPLLQESFRRETGRTPYRLYSLSNIGSLLALLTYPFVFEPRLTLRMQSVAWSIGYAAFVALCLWSAVAFVRVWRIAPVASEIKEDQVAAERPSARMILLWLALAACGSLMLLATTNQLCQEVTSVPFLWILPLSLYLLTFIICFDHERWYHRNTFVVLLAFAVLLGCYGMFRGNELPVAQQLLVYSTALFVCCMVCHGELVQSKPAPQYATLFYLMVSAGGALGGILVAIVAPLVLRGYWEYPIGLLATVGLAIFSSQLRSETRFELPKPIWIVGGALAVAGSLAVGVIAGRRGQTLETTLESTRNFYGVLRVNREESLQHDNGPERELVHGSIQHGFQFLDADKKKWPTSYYGHESGVGLAVDRHPRRLAGEPLRIAVVGLGVGTMAAYGQKGDLVRFYEINPEVIRLSDKYFSYRKDTPATVEVILGDARINLERELAEHGSNKFDVLAIDAFSSDSIPMHLLTKESVELYLKHLKPDGILCIHISNRFLDLESVVLAIAQELGFPCVFIDSKASDETGVNGASWILLTQNYEFLNDPKIHGLSKSCWPPKGEPVLWTDDYGSLWQVLSD
jgi:SAM-dependent methyltransferase